MTKGEATPVAASTLAATLLERDVARGPLARAMAPQPEVRRLTGQDEPERTLREVVRAGGARTIGVLFAVNLVDEFDRAAFAVLGPDIQRSLHLSDVQLGLAGSLSGFTVLLAAVPIGLLSDRTRRTRLLAWCTFLWAGLAALTGLATSALQLIGARVLAGLGKANEAPVQKAILADAYEIGGRARIFALHNAANPIGHALGPLLAGAITLVVAGPDAWRWAFPLLGVPAILGGMAALRVPEPERGSNERRALRAHLGERGVEVDDGPAITLRAGFARLRRIATFNAFLGALGALGFAAVSAPIYLNLVLDRELGLSSAQRGLVVTIGAVGALVGVAVGGRFGDRLFRQRPEAAVLLVAGAIAFYGVTLPISLFMPNAVAYTAVHMVSHALIAAATVPALAILTAVTPYRLRSLGLATVGIYLALVGGVGGVVVVGTLSSALGPRTALAIAVPPAAIAGAILLARGALSVRDDLAAAAAEVDEQHDHALRMQASRAGTAEDLPLLEVRALDVRYGQVQVLFGVDLDVRRGEVLALLGTNGAGKSTLLRAVSGLVVPDRGTIRFDGSDITYLDAPQRVDLGILQIRGGAGVFGGLSVRDNLLAGCHSHGWDGPRTAAATAAALRRFPPLGRRLEQPAGALSGGEQQMLAVAKALLLEPRLLVIDELSLGLAPVVVEQLLGVVDELREQGLTMIIVEQSLNVAAAIADRAVFMEKGEIRFEGSPRELLERGDLARAVFLGGPA